VIKKYIVRLSAEEREVLENVIKKLKGSSEKVRRAHILLKTEVDGPNWADAKIAEAFSCSTRNVELIRERFVTEGFELVLNGKNVKIPLVKNCLIENKKLKLLRCVWGPHQKDLEVCHYDFLQIK